MTNRPRPDHRDLPRADRWGDDPDRVDRARLWLAFAGGALTAGALIAIVAALT